MTETQILVDAILQQAERVLADGHEPPFNLVLVDAQGRRTEGAISLVLGLPCLEIVSGAERLLPPISAMIVGDHFAYEVGP